MADINTTLRGNNEEKEDPKSPGVIAKKIIQGLIIIILAVAVWTMSSWQLPVIVETVNCMFKIDQTNLVHFRQMKMLLHIVLERANLIWTHFKHFLILS